MKSIKAKFSILMISAVAVSCCTIGLVGRFFAANILKQSAEENLKLKAELCTSLVVDRVEQIEACGEAISNVIREEAGSDIDELVNNREKIEVFVEDSKEHAMAIADKSCDDCIIYLRLNPDYFDPLDGFYIQRMSADSDFFDLPKTDFSKFPEDDIEHVGWYYVPMENKESTWMDRYPNPVTGERLLSYIVPIYKSGIPIGVLGMDLNLDVLDTIVDSIDIYETGISFIVSERGVILGHNELSPREFTEDIQGVTKDIIDNVPYKTDSGKIMRVKYDKESYIVYSHILPGPAYYVMAVPNKEILEELGTLIIYFMVLTGIIGIITILFTTNLTDKMVKPLKNLTLASEKIALGDYSTEIEVIGNDELAVLAAALKHTSSELNKLMGYINKRAYIDGLTGLQNKTAYMDAVAKLEDQWDELQQQVTVFVMDVNNLKPVNDTYGHDVGDVMLIDAASCLRNVFSEENCYRIGGDEFVAIVYNQTEEDIQKLKRRFKSEMKQFNKIKHMYERDLVIALGSASYHANDTFDDMFNRADAKMYTNKKRLKNGEEVR